MITFRFGQSERLSVRPSITYGYLDEFLTFKHDDSFKKFSKVRMLKLYWLFLTLMCFNLPMFVCLTIRFAFMDAVTLVLKTKMDKKISRISSLYEIVLFTYRLKYQRWFSGFLPYLFWRTFRIIEKPNF